ncbi:hypothetical protein I4Q36_00390 [Tuanshanicoccus lijuaniae]|uniref:hypothetical protein n=1 Tax=Aerococcaceae bacterium zg-1292 TaxID=2774330 RepID=UPI0019372C40|nr:hypothetical protein [Aerococcaceae bacterium zg-1292]MBF6625359.1 hypothetical protein [Aerococcaceae bacterium zg-BR9]MBF6979019.1 hypothetical protein [Aerococcaceae bacterium zg-BR22]MBS4456120.1 hypothetical protein [Aerococcaceae bacterium zg-A91]MBS4457971.1 hypothetical protein [Aerococcaceae bacterium zg-BR33]
MSKNRLGRVLLGAAVAVAGVSLYLYIDENARTKVESVINREKAKAFIRQNLKGSQNLIDAIDKLTDTELNSVMKLMNETEKTANKVADQAGSAVNQFVDRAKEFGNDVADKVSDFMQ